VTALDFRDNVNNAIKKLVELNPPHESLPELDKLQMRDGQSAKDHSRSLSRKRFEGPVGCAEGVVEVVEGDSLAEQIVQPRA
jgi:hypothetical protein